MYMLIHTWTLFKFCGSFFQIVNQHKNTVKLYNATPDFIPRQSDLQVAVGEIELSPGLVTHHLHKHCQC